LVFWLVLFEILMFPKGFLNVSKFKLINLNYIKGLILLFRVQLKDDIKNKMLQKDKYFFKNLKQSTIPLRFHKCKYHLNLTIL